MFTVSKTKSFSVSLVSAFHALRVSLCDTVCPGEKRGVVVVACCSARASHVFEHQHMVGCCCALWSVACLTGSAGTEAMLLFFFFCSEGPAPGLHWCNLQQTHLIAGVTQFRAHRHLL